MNRRFLILLIACVLASVIPLSAQTTLGEMYLDKELPEAWISDTTFVQQLPVTGRWWASLDDTLLDSLISVAFVNSPDLRTVFYRVQSSHAALRMQQSEYYPSLNLSLGWNKSQSSGRVGSATNTSRESYFSGALSTTWEIDLFGATYNRVRSQKALYRASVEEYNAALVSLAAQVASAYARLRMLQQELLVARENIASQQSILDITEARYTTGLTSQLDVAQARSVYFSTMASVPSLEADIVVQVNVLALLVGTHPHELLPTLQDIRPIPDYRMIIPIGVPANLLRQRPDIRAAEQSLVSAAALLGAARADYLPQLSLSGSIGFASEKMDNFFDHRSLTYEIAPTITWTLFQGRHYTQASKQAKAELEASVEQYNLAVLTAIEEVDNAMVTYKGAVRQLQILQDLVAQGELTLTLSLDLYKRGLTTFQNVLDAQRSLLTYQNGLATSQGAALTAVIDLYRALGGGWDNSN
ncbi:MAG: TolC family protein [Coprobacter sp.]|nr:TolC family protein [Coprobacter sp.]